MLEAFSNAFQIGAVCLILVGGPVAVIFGLAYGTARWQRPGINPVNFAVLVTFVSFCLTILGLGIAVIVLFGITTPVLGLVLTFAMSCAAIGVYTGYSATSRLWYSDIRWPRR